MPVHASLLNKSFPERRSAPRRSVQLAAKVGIRDGAPIACTIVNISTLGALIEFREPVMVPKRFRIAVDGLMFSAECEVRHASPTSVGVMFVSNRNDAFVLFG